MPDAINYCDMCGKIILPSDLEAGHAINTDAASMCRECLNKLPDDKRAALKRRSSPGASDTPGRQTARRRDSSTRHSTTDAPKVSRTSVILRLTVVVAAALGGASVTLMLVGAKQDGPPAAPPVVPAVAVPAPVVSALPSQPNDEKPATAAAQQLAAIESLRTPDLSKYLEMRTMLTKLLEAEADAQEAKDAKALLAEIDAAHAKLADEALARALESARAKAKTGYFDQAELSIKSIESLFGTGPWFETKGKAAVTSMLAEIAEGRAREQRGKAAVVLGKARSAFEAGSLEAARTLLDGHAGWPADNRAAAEKLIAEIEAKVAAAAAAKKLVAEREAMLAEFDRLIALSEYAKARAYAETKAVGANEELFAAAARVAQAIADTPASRIGGAKTLIGREVALKLTTGPVTVTVKDVSENGLTATQAYTINNQTRTKTITFTWDVLDADQKSELAKLGGLDVPASVGGVVAAYVALNSGELDAALTALEAAGDHPLASRLVADVRRRQAQRAYETTIENAKELIDKKRWKEARAACKKALELKPNDPAAIELFAKVELHVGPPRTLTLDLGPSTELGTGGRVTMELVYIRPGTFVMGSDRGPRHGSEPSGKPKHEVTITKGFYLGTYEVTQAQYEKVMGENRSQSKEQNRPVTHMTWKGAARFCQKASETTRREVRLPTEAEWEYACRAGTTTEWSHGNDEAKLGKYAWYNANAGGATHPVGQKKPNAWGLYDMHGNAAEFVANDPAGYKPGPRVDAYTTGSSVRRVFRGGGCGGGAYSLRSAYRCQTKIFRPAPVGFRVVVTNTGAEDLEPVTSASE